MALTKLQKEIMASIAKNRSETSYVAGGLVLNMNWPRLSDDIDIFQDTDEEIGPVAERDMETLRTDGFRVSVEVNVYGCVEAEVSKAQENTLIQWMSERSLQGAGEYAHSMDERISNPVSPAYSRQGVGRKASPSGPCRE